VTLARCQDRSESQRWGTKCYCCRQSSEKKPEFFDKIINKKSHKRHKRKDEDQDESERSTTLFRYAMAPVKHVTYYSLI
jgi:hypothetical protein